MCLAIPARIVALDRVSETALVDLAGIQKEVSTQLLDEVEIGDYVLVHVGYALNRLNAEEAARTLALFDELDEMNETGETP